MKFSPSLPAQLIEPVHFSQQFSIIFRRAQLADLDALYSACYSHLPYSRFRVRFEFGLKEQEAGRRIHLLADLSREGNNETHLAGTGHILSFTRTVAEIANLVVAEPYRGQGVGSALVRAMVTIARSAGAHRVEIGANVENQRALALYRRLGFQPVRQIALPEQGTVLILKISLLDRDSRGEI